MPTRTRPSGAFATTAVGVALGLTLAVLTLAVVRGQEAADDRCTAAGGTYQARTTGYACVDRAGHVLHPSRADGQR